MDALIAAAIHDAKNGLNALNTWIAEAQRERPSAALTEAQAIAARVGAQLVELLALYRDSEGSLRLAVDDHDLMDFCTDLCAEFALPAGSSLRLDADFSAAAGIGAWAFDAYQVKLLLLDALRNSSRHAKAGIRFGVARASEGLVFAIADDGPGFPPEVLRGADTAMDSGSSGLGLRFARLIARRHTTPNGRHGRIELANAAAGDSGGGARFQLFLP